MEIIQRSAQNYAAKTAYSHALSVHRTNVDEHAHTETVVGLDLQLLVAGIGGSSECGCRQDSRGGWRAWGVCENVVMRRLGQQNASLVKYTVYESLCLVVPGRLDLPRSCSVDAADKVLSLELRLNVVQSAIKHIVHKPCR